MSTPRINLGHFNLMNLRIEEAQSLLDVMQGFMDMRTGTVLSKGYHCRNYIRKKTDYEFTLSGDIEFVRNFNPAIINPDNSKILRLLLNPCYAGRVFVPGGCVLPISTDASCDKFYAFVNYTGILVSVDRYNEPVVHLYEQKVESSGGSARIMRQLGTVRYRMLSDMPNLVYEVSRKQRIVRMVSALNIDSHLAILRRDYGKFKMFSHLGVRGPQFISTPFKVEGNEDSDGIYCATSMKYLEEKDLYDVLNAESKHSALSLEDRFDLSLELLIKLYLQVHARKFKHRDLKPENIRAVKLVSDWKLNLIDYNDALPMLVEDGRDCGTLHYRPKEMFERQSSQKSDIYCAGLIMGLFWGMDALADIEDIGGIDYIKMSAAITARKEKSNWEINWASLKGMPALPAVVKSAIINLLTKMTAVDQKDRPDVKECIDQMEAIYREYSLSLLPEQLRLDVRKSYRAAKICRLELERYTAKPIQSLQNIGMLEEIVLRSLHDVVDIPECIRAFVKASKLHALPGVTSKLDLFHRVQTLFKIFNAAFKLIETVEAEMKRLYEATGVFSLTASQSAKRDDLPKQICHIELFKTKIFSASLDINLMQDLTDKMIHKHGKLKKSLHYFNELQQLIDDRSALKFYY